LKRIALLAIAGLIFGSCTKDDPEPVTGYDSQLAITNTKFYNLIIADSVIGAIDFQFITKKDSLSENDTTEFSQRLEITGAQETRTIYFNTPKQTIISNFTVRFQVYGAAADSVNIENFVYKKDGTTLVSQPLYFLNNFSTFRSFPVSYHF
jgi:hypothetical protein